MKKLYLFTLASIICNTQIFSQDTLFLNSGDFIPAKVTEIGIDQIKYKKPSNPDGPNYVTNKSDVSSIHYFDGSKDVFSYSSNSKHYNVAAADDANNPALNNSKNVKEETSNLPSDNNVTTVNQTYEKPRPLLNFLLGAAAIIAVTNSIAHPTKTISYYNTGYHHCNHKRGRHW